MSRFKFLFKHTHWSTCMFLLSCLISLSHVHNVFYYSFTYLYLISTHTIMPRLWTDGRTGQSATRYFPPQPSLLTYLYIHEPCIKYSANKSAILLFHLLPLIGIHSSHRNIFIDLVKRFNWDKSNSTKKFPFSWKCIF